jgi:hypothetical protein
MKTDGIERTHPMISFQMRNVIDEDKNDFIEIDKNLADRIGHVDLKPNLVRIGHGVCG